MVGDGIGGVAVKVPGGEISFGEILLQNLVFRVDIEPELVLKDFSGLDIDFPQVIFFQDPY